MILLSSIHIYYDLFISVITFLAFIIFFSLVLFTFLPTLIVSILTIYLCHLFLLFFFFFFLLNPCIHFPLQIHSQMYLPYHIFLISTIFISYSYINYHKIKICGSTLPCNLIRILSSHKTDKQFFYLYF